MTTTLYLRLRITLDLFLTPHKPFDGIDILYFRLSVAIYRTIFVFTYSKTLVVVGFSACALLQEINAAIATRLGRILADYTKYCSVPR